MKHIIKFIGIYLICGFLATVNAQPIPPSSLDPTKVVGYNPLPVELTSFKASVSENKVFLSWQTANEVNSYGFSLERRTKSEGWETIGFITGNGNSNSTNEYFFTDIPSVGSSQTLKYRLKQMDTDGSFTYSKEIEITLNNIPKQYVLLQNYPNPFNPTTKIKYQLPESGKVTLKIYDVVGREIVTILNEQKEAGYYEVEWNANETSSGIYYYKIQAGAFTEIKKMLLIK